MPKAGKAAVDKAHKVLKEPKVGRGTANKGYKDLKETRVLKVPRV